MRKLYSFVAGVLAIIIILSGLAFFLEKQSGSGKQSDKLVIYNWGITLTLLCF